MASRASPRLQSRRVGFLLGLLLLVSGCFLLKKNSSGSSSATHTLILANSVYIDRLGAGDAARVQFKTSANAVCELAFYVKDAAQPPTIDQPTVVPCSNQIQPRSEFVEKLTGLHSGIPIYLVITAWVPPAGKAQGERLTVRETDNSIVTGGSASATFKDLLVARFDVPLMSAEVHRHAPAAPVDTATIQAKLTRKLGCQQGVQANDAPFRDAAGDIGIKNLATRDFATASASANPDHPERLQLTYSAVNSGLNQWTLLYKSADNRDVVVPAQPMSQILNMEMESANITNFDAPQLAKAAESFKIDPTKPLKFSWTTTNNLLDLSYMTVQIGRPDYDKAIYCVFAAGKNVGVVDPSFLQNLDDGDQVVMAELASNQLWVKDGWLLTVYDWRSGRIEK